MYKPKPLSPVGAYEAIQRILDIRDGVSWTQHARDRAAQRHFTADDVMHVLRRGRVQPNPDWNEKFSDCAYTVNGVDCDGVALAVVIAIEPEWIRITLITGKDTND